MACWLVNKRELVYGLVSWLATAATWLLTVSGSRVRFLVNCFTRYLLIPAKGHSVRAVLKVKCVLRIGKGPTHRLSGLVCATNW